MLSLNPTDHRLRREFAQSVHDHWKLFFLEGVILLVLGAAAMVIPPIASLAVTILFGWLFLVAGMVGLLTTVWMRHAPGFWWSLLSAVLATACGVFMIGWPLSGILSLTFLLIVFFAIEGLASIMFALEHQRQLPDRWGWMLASGIVDLVLAAIILFGLPWSAAWAIGLLVGINMMFGGVALIAMAMTARHIDPARVAHSH
jgi:uncharacterized membrane protein HdeD (DUF308 family)